VVEVAVANGAHNQLVTFDPAGPEAEARLGRKEISVDALIEAGDLGEQSRPLGPLVEGAMKLPVRTCPLQRIGRLRRLHQNRFLMLEISARERRRGVPQRMGFERRAKLRKFPENPARKLARRWPRDWAEAPPTRRRSDAGALRAPEQRSRRTWQRRRFA
jgi:hypothetical protein